MAYIRVVSPTILAARGLARWPDARSTFLALDIGGALALGLLDVESAAGVGEGGRTGLTALVVAALFLMAVFA